MTTSHLDPQAVHERVGFVGMGTMGAAMALNLAKAGFALTVWNRTPGRASQIVAAGAVEVATAQELAAASDVVVMCLTDSPQVEAVLFGETGLASGLAPGSIVVDCTTLSPLKAREFATRLHTQGVSAVDAPVSGGSEARGTQRSPSWSAVRTRTSLESIPFCERWQVHQPSRSGRSGSVGQGHQPGHSLGRLPRGGGRSHARVEGDLDAQKVVDALVGGAADRGC